MSYSYQQLESILTKEIRRVFKIFSDFFGPDFVDLHEGDYRDYLDSALRILPVGDDNTYDLTEEQIKDLIQSCYTGSYILVWWPSVKVTNEFGRFTIIKDLYAKITLNTQGFLCGTFRLNRSTYTLKEWCCNYMHSHVARIPKSNLYLFEIPCLGNGPIKRTCETLQGSSDDTEWMLFCQELSLYVTVESIHGVPYKYIEQLKNGGTKLALDKYYITGGIAVREKEAFDASLFGFNFDIFIKEYLKNCHLKFSFVNGEYVLGIPLYEYLFDISNFFIESVNKHSDHPKVSSRLLESYTFDGNNFYTLSDSNALRLTDREVTVVQNYHMFDFKGKPVCLTITEDSSSGNNKVRLLNITLSLYALNSILKIINFHYNNDNINSFKQSGQSSETDKKILYL